MIFAWVAPGDHLHLVERFTAAQQCHEWDKQKMNVKRPVISSRETLESSQSMQQSRDETFVIWLRGTIHTQRGMTMAMMKIYVQETRIRNVLWTSNFIWWKRETTVSVYRPLSSSLSSGFTVNLNEKSKSINNQSTNQANTKAWQKTNSQSVNQSVNQSINR